MAAEYYVYVYIDPRNNEEFYYGKGKGSRKQAHLFEAGESPKVKRIAAIKSAGALPVIRVLARDLTEEQALLIEATLLWRLGKFTTNLVAGHFSELFRPHDTMHQELPGYDFQNGLYYFNLGNGPHRQWEDCRRFQFISAGQGKRWSDAIRRFKKGDVFAAYLKAHGFVGIGRILEPARMAREVLFEGKPLLSHCPRMARNWKSEALSEYVALVKWIKDVPAKDAKMRRKAGIFTTTHVRASLDGQPKTVEFLEKELGVNFKKILC